MVAPTCPRALTLCAQEHYSNLVSHPENPHLKIPLGEALGIKKLTPEEVDALSPDALSHQATIISEKWERYAKNLRRTMISAFSVRDLGWTSYHCGDCKSGYAALVKSAINRHKEACRT
ncbi:MAG: hypothetical protein SP1CHLAM54_02900 [Chlamydiia bacterium]|nr:hypothetical protein [Chlamydiia bacterium]MCH9615206.1 hypothetical protein [Chlamydiia bacterium]MCH9628472.1 hypothetical protein [Chlamydiia bacterium]